VITDVTVDWVGRAYWYVHTAYFLVVLLIAPVLGVLALAWALDLAKARLATGRRWTGREEGFGLVALLMIGFAALAMVGRADSIHVGLYAVPALLVATVLADRWRRRVAGPGFGLVRWLPVAFLVGWLAAGAVVQGHAMAVAPEKWLRLASPDARHLATPAVRYLREHGRPGDRLIGFPYADAYGFYCFPLDSALSQVMPPGYRYNTPEEFEAFWQEILKKRPRWVVYHPHQPDAKVHDLYFTHPLVGYRLVATLPSMLFKPELPAYIYERE
jgi:hypothetical protein